MRRGFFDHKFGCECNWCKGSRGRNWGINPKKLPAGSPEMQARIAKIMERIAQQEAEI